MNTMNVSDTCNAAADLLHGRGWTQGDGWDDNGSPLCLEGALAAASGIRGFVPFRVQMCPAYRAVKDHVGTLPWIWNDMTARSADQVIATLRAVAVIHAAREDESAETRAVEAVSR